MVVTVQKKKTIWKMDFGELHKMHSVVAQQQQQWQHKNPIRICRIEIVSWSMHSNAYWQCGFSVISAVAQTCSAHICIYGIFAFKCIITNAIIHHLWLFHELFELIHVVFYGAQLLVNSMFITVPFPAVWIIYMAYQIA